MPSEVFSSFVLHDMANAVNAVSGVAETLAEHADELSADERAMLLGSLVRQASVLRRLVADLADLEALQDGTFEVDVRPVRLREAVATAVAQTDRPDDAVHVRVDDDLEVLADPDRLQQVLVNLLTNARVHGGPAVWVEADRRADRAVLTVSDDGAGMAPSLADRMFEPHRRAPEAGPRPGRGLGLAIVRGLVTSFGGTIRYVRRPRGSQFVVELPAVARRAADATHHDGDHAPFDHAAIVYRSDGELETEVATLVRDGLDAGDGVVLVITPEHWRGVRALLAHRRGELGAAIATGQLVVQDADTLLAQFHDGVSPNRHGFEAIVGGLVGSVADRFGAVRIFGEMVDLLWTDGDVVGALALEQMWNHLWARQPFALLCGYRVPAGTSPDDPALQQVAHHHGLVITAP